MIDNDVTFKDFEDSWEFLIDLYPNQSEFEKMLKNWNLTHEEIFKSNQLFQNYLK